jgi:hypothetical protein
MAEPESATGHITDDHLAGYLDRSLSSGAREQIEGHLADCAECRAEMRATARLLQSQKSRRQWYLGSSLVAAAALVLLVVANPFSTSTPAEVAFRGPLDAGNRLISATGPEDGAIIDSDDLTFVWSAIEPDVRYHITLTNARGDDLWSHETTDTLVTIPADVDLVPGESYFWYVDALLLDGRSVTSGTRRFELAR